jgi:hypothetical protein
VAQVEEPIADGLAKLEAEPALYSGLWYQTNMVDWPADQQKYKLIHRTQCGFSAKVDEGGSFTYRSACYQVPSPPGPAATERISHAISRCRCHHQRALHNI